MSTDHGECYELIMFLIAEVSELSSRNRTVDHANISYTVLELGRE